MIEFTTGNLFEAKVDALVNPVNCVGVAGAGLALQFKRLYPTNFRAYQKACDYRNLRPGKVFVFKTGNSPPYIVNFPTKRHWKDASKLADIKAGLGNLAAELAYNSIGSVAIPALGCGLGGLDWRDVRPLIEQILGSLGARVIVYEPLTEGG